MNADGSEPTGMKPATLTQGAWCRACGKSAVSVDCDCGMILSTLDPQLGEVWEFESIVAETPDDHGNYKPYKRYHTGVIRMVTRRYVVWSDELGNVFLETRFQLVRRV